MAHAPRAAGTSQHCGGRPGQQVGTHSLGDPAAGPRLQFGVRSACGSLRARGSGPGETLRGETLMDRRSSAPTEPDRETGPRGRRSYQELAGRGYPSWPEAARSLVNRPDRLAQTVVVQRCRNPCSQGADHRFPKAGQGRYPWRVQGRAPALLFDKQLPAALGIVRLGGTNRPRE